MFQIKWIWENLKGYRKRYILALCITVVCQIMYILNPTFASKIVDIFIYNDNAAENIETKKNLLIGLCCCIVGFTLLRAIMQFTSNMLFETCSQGMLSKIRSFLFKNAECQDMSFYDKHSTGDLMTRLSGDLDMVRHTVAWIIKTFVESMALYITTVVYFLCLDPILAVSLIALTPLIFIISNIFRDKVGPKYVDLRERMSKLNSSAEENIAGNRVIRAFAREDYEIEKFEKKNSEYSASNKDAAFTWLTFFPYIETLAQALSVVLLIVGGIFVINGRITMGVYVAFSGLIWTLSNPMRNVGALINDFQHFLASANKIIEVYYSRPLITDRADAVETNGRLNGEIEFRDVSFGYNEGKEVLSHVSFKINAGETVAIMGETGSGKTSLINLIPRCYDVTSGEVLVDGVNVRYRKLHDLRKNIGVAMQDVLLWSDTIEGNIAFYDSDMSLDEVKKYAKLADADEFASKLSEGYDTIVGERGVGLSGGQKQRISLARALAMQPAILILDDTTSAVDTETERQIQHNLKNLDFNCTKLIIAQRTSSAKNADRIMIIKDGKVAQFGTHDELMQDKNGYYYEIYTLQNGDEKEAV